MKALYILPLVFVAACGGGSSELGSPPTASTGYAKPGDSIIGSDGVAFKTKMPMLYFSGEGERETVMRDVTLTQSDSGNTMIAVIDGTIYVMPWNSSSGHWEGTVGTATAVLSPGALIGDEQLGSGYLRNWDGSLGADSFSYLGYNVTGFDTDPTEVAAQTGTVEFNGTSELIISHGGGDNVFASGDASFTADFSAGTVEGLLTVSTDFADDPANATADNAEISLLSTSIQGNMFETTISLDPADFAMDTFEGGDSSGQFFGVDAANVGGYVYGNGTADGGATNVLLQGGFITER